MYITYVYFIMYNGRETESSFVMVENNLRVFIIALRVSNKIRTRRRIVSISKTAGYFSVVWNTHAAIVLHCPWRNSNDNVTALNSPLFCVLSFVTGGIAFKTQRQRWPINLRHVVQFMYEYECVIYICVRVCWSELYQVMLGTRVCACYMIC
jgi:hypothetical protein